MQRRLKPAATKREEDELILKYFLYFLLGGCIVTLVSYFGATKRTLLSSFIATLPCLSLATFILIYKEGGVGAAIAYGKGLILFLPAWLCYVVMAIFLLPRWEMWKALSVAVMAYLIVALVTKRLSESF
ncbi:MAG TPA: DUF3147 domain-containing protein [Candidatus Hypogeohydataceae bacterium YC41]